MGRQPEQYHPISQNPLRRLFLLRHQSRHLQGLGTPILHSHVPIQPLQNMVQMVNLDPALDECRLGRRTLHRQFRAMRSRAEELESVHTRKVCSNLRTLDGKCHS